MALSIDEVASLHETVSPTIRDALGVGGFLYYAWLIAALLMVAIVGALLTPWFVSLPQRLRITILVAGGLFLAGTVVLELIGGYLADTGTRMSTEWTVVASIEESLELIGVAVLFSGLV